MNTTTTTTTSPTGRARRVLNRAAHAVASAAVRVQAATEPGGRPAPSAAGPQFAGFLAALRGDRAGCGDPGCHDCADDAPAVPDGRSWSLMLAGDLKPGESAKINGCTYRVVQERRVDGGSCDECGQSGPLVHLYLVDGATGADRVATLAAVTPLLGVPQAPDDLAGVLS